MKKILILIFTCIALTSIAQTNSKQKLQTQTIKVGGVDINIPLPDTTFVEISNKYRGLVELFVPQSNRLLSAYVLKSELQGFLNLKPGNSLSEFALIEVPLQGEDMNFEPNDYEEFMDGAKEYLGGDLTSIKNETEEEFNSRIKSIGLANMQIKYGQPTQLGCFFSKKDIIAWGMLMSYEMNGLSSKMSIVTIFIRVKKRLLYIYLYSEYKNEETLVRLRSFGKKWSDEILKVNIP